MDEEMIGHNQVKYTASKAFIPKPYTCLTLRIFYLPSHRNKLTLEMMSLARWNLRPDSRDERGYNGDDLVGISEISTTHLLGQKHLTEIIRGHIKGQEQENHMDSLPLQTGISYLDVRSGCDVFRHRTLSTRVIAYMDSFLELLERLYWKY